MRWNLVKWHTINYSNLILKTLILSVCIAVLSPTIWVWGQGQSEAEQSQDLSSYEGLIVREVILDGLKRVDPQFVYNQIRTTVGEPFSMELINDNDIRNLTRLNEFKRIGVEARLHSDGGVIVRFIFDEWPLASDIQVVGNRSLSDQVLLKPIILRPGDPLDTYQINLARERIIELYKQAGFHLVEVTIDTPALTENNAVIFHVREGPRVKIKQIEFRGNNNFESKLLQSKIKTKTAVPFLRQGRLEDDVMNTDVRTLLEYYQDRGFLDVRVDRQIDLSNDLKESKIIFLIDEGPLYTMRDVKVYGATRLHSAQLSALMQIKPGDVYSRDKVLKSKQAIEEAYGLLGYIDVNVDVQHLRDTTTNVVDLVLTVYEGDLSMTGEVRVIGNKLTKREVILRESLLRLGRPLSKPALDETERRLHNTRLFQQDKIAVTPQSPDPDNPGFRDVVIEVAEDNTGAFNFGGAVSSDLGVYGAISVEQRNFDSADYPENFSEFIKGRAFRGGGQTFNISLQPGNQVSNYSVSLTEPYLFGTDNSLNSSVLYTERVRESFDETRWGGRLRLGRRLGEIWRGDVFTRYHSINLHDIDVDAPRDVFAVQDEKIVTGLGFSLVRSTFDNGINPSKGTRIELSVEQIGALGGDFDFTRLNAGHTFIVTIDEDFLGRKSLITFKTDIGYQFGGTTPTYERFYLGGRSLRGFDYRTVSPKGIKNNTGLVGTDPVGGDWLFAWGAQYSFPMVDQYIGGVFFVDTGTVTNDPGFEQYRVAVGTGLRLFIPQFGQAPLAFDLAWPIALQDGDQKRLFSFSIQLPY